nr:hypothetical protein [Vagococcus penaei]
MDIESAFGWMKVSLVFTRYHVPVMEKVCKETGLLIIALNLRKLEITMRKKEDELYQKGIESKISKR